MKIKHILFFILALISVESKAQDPIFTQNEMPKQIEVPVFANSAHMHASPVNMIPAENDKVREWLSDVFPPDPLNFNQFDLLAELTQEIDQNLSFCKKLKRNLKCLFCN